jgi:CubicO group peptidase (beta-lactamase class C family)
MRVLKWALRAFLVFVIIAAGLAVWKREDLSRLLAVNSLFDADRIVHNFSHMDRLFWTTPLMRGDGPISPLPQGNPAALPDGAERWLSDRSVTALIVLKNGQIRHEGYYQGTGPQDRRISWSMAKSFVSALIGQALQNGEINSLDDPVTKYAPQLTSSAYDGVRIIDVLHMASGVTFDEDYLNFYSDINKMGRTLAIGGSMDAFAAGLTERDAPAGQRWHYASIDTHVIAMVLRGATGRSLPDLMAQRLIAPLGPEDVPLMITDAHGVGFALGGLNMRTRDYARFGQMVAQGGLWQDQRILPEGWVERSTQFTAPTAPDQSKYALQWWGASDAKNGDFFARGVYGQYIYIDQARDVVIVMNAADRQFRNTGINQQNIQMFRQIAASFDKE